MKDRRIVFVCLTEEGEWVMGARNSDDVSAPIGALTRLVRVLSKDPDSFSGILFLNKNAPICVIVNEKI